jgi:hypothetical protein
MYFFVATVEVEEGQGGRLCKLQWQEKKWRSFLFLFHGITNETFLNFLPFGLKKAPKYKEIRLVHPGSGS